MRSPALREALNPKSAREVILSVLNAHRHSSMLGSCSCGGVEYDDEGPFEGELAEHEKHQAAIVAAELVRLNLASDGVEADALAVEVQRALGAHRRQVAPAQCTCGIRYIETDLFEGGKDQHDVHAAAVVVGQLQVRRLVEAVGGVVVTNEAVTAALTAMEGVTPPPGVSKREWLQQWGSAALVAGGIAAALNAAAPADPEADTDRDAEAKAWALLAGHALVYPHKATGLRLSCVCGALLDDFDVMVMSSMERYGRHLASVIASEGWRPTAAGDTEIRRRGTFNILTHP